MAKQLMQRRSSSWTFVLKFKVMQGNRSLEAIKVLSTPSWGPAFLALVLALGSFGVFYAIKHPPGTGIVTASMAAEPSEATTSVMKQLEDAQLKRDFQAFLSERERINSGAPPGGYDVITPLNVRDPSALVMGPSTGY